MTYLLTDEAFAKLEGFVRRARRLGSPKASDPEAFHVAQSEFAHDLQRFADQVAERRLESARR